MIDNDPPDQIDELLSPEGMALAATRISESLGYSVGVRYDASRVILSCDNADKLFVHENELRDYYGGDQRRAIAGLTERMRCYVPKTEEPCELDIVDNRQELEKTLSEKLGYRVMVDKIANRIYVHKVIEVGALVSEAVEQELYADPRGPLGLLVERATQVIPYPAHVTIRREDLQWIPGSAFVPSRATREPFVATSEGPAYFCTLSSEKGKDLRRARNQLAELMGCGTLTSTLRPVAVKSEEESEAPMWRDGQGRLHNIRTLKTNPDSQIETRAMSLVRARPSSSAKPPTKQTIVVLRGIKEYQDVISQDAQTWADVAILDGAWEWNETAKQMVRSLA